MKSVALKIRDPLAEHRKLLFFDNVLYWAVSGSIGLMMPQGLGQSRDHTGLSVAGWFLRPGEEMTTDGVVRRIMR